MGSTPTDIFFWMRVIKIKNEILKPITEGTSDSVSDCSSSAFLASDRPSDSSPFDGLPGSEANISWLSSSNLAVSRVSSWVKFWRSSAWLSPGWLEPQKRSNSCEIWVSLNESIFSRMSIGSSSRIASWTYLNKIDVFHGLISNLNPRAVGIWTFKWCNLKNSNLTFWTFYRHLVSSKFYWKTQVTIFVIFWGNS